MDEFLENLKLPKLIHDEKDQGTIPITIKEIKFVAKNSRKRKVQAHFVSLENFRKHKKKELHTLKYYVVYLKLR